MTLNIKDGDYVKLRDGSICGSVIHDPSREYCWRIPELISWREDGRYIGSKESPFDIIEVLPGKPVFIDTPFEVGKRYRTRDGDTRKITGFALRLSNGMTSHLNGSSRFDCLTSTSDLLPGAIEDEEQVTVAMPKADYDRAMELLGRARG